MKDDELKNIWNMINDDTQGYDAIQTTSDQIISSRSGSIQSKIKAMLQNDLIFKVVSGIALLINLAFYWSTPAVIYVCLGGILFHAIMTTIEWKTLQGLNRISDPGLSTREVLSNILIYIRRKSNLYEITIASSQVLIFVPGLLIYFFLVYGQVKPMTGESFAVFTILALIGTVGAFSRIKSQLRYHINYLHVCLSDLNEGSLQFAFNAIDNKRRQDDIVKMLVYFLLIFGFVALIAVLKSIVG